MGYKSIRTLRKQIKEAVTLDQVPSTPTDAALESILQEGFDVQYSTVRCIIQIDDTYVHTVEDEVSCTRELNAWKVKVKKLVDVFTLSMLQRLKRDFQAAQQAAAAQQNAEEKSE